VALALYRRYRPSSFSEVIGQEHVTGPLERALASDRTHHAYLFSGPRGCGKTTSARVLARSLNCEQGPTATPCGVCTSCIELEPNGTGSLDVIEIDAATHGGVDDARELRERAMYAPVSSRYKVYIIDEAHQLSRDANNALLKLIEEPPSHLRFVFATTEPDKILPTIRSRTHHYPFRLVPQRTLAAHLAAISDSEKITYEPAALAVIAKAAEGSVRDSLSLLGQLAGGAGPEGLTYDDVVAQLGVTSEQLLDDVVESLATHDGARLLDAVSRVVDAGHDPRRFATDLLERFRDLVVLAAAPDAAAAGLVDAAPDRLAALQTQANSLGLAALSRAADLVSSGITELKGSTSPRLQLELMAARLLLPAADPDDAGLLVRLDRIERRLNSQAAGIELSEAERAAAAAMTPAVHHTPPPAPTPTAPPATPAAASGGAPARAAESARAAAAAPKPADTSTRKPPRRLSDVAPRTAETGAAAATPNTTEPATSEPVNKEPAAAEAAPTPAVSATAKAGSGPDLGQIRALWPSVLDSLKSDSRVAWMCFADSTPISLTDGTLTIAVAEVGKIANARASGHDLRLTNAAHDVLHTDVKLDIVHDPGAKATPASVDAEASPDDASVEATDGVALLKNQLGATVITEFDQ
jgi:DNA polymerase-3 subunit gamma/tau